LPHSTQDMGNLLPSRLSALPRKVHMLRFFRALRMTNRSFFVDCLCKISRGLVFHLDQKFRGYRGQKED
jgi:hypothetical protein